MCVFTDKIYKRYAALVLVPVVAINTYVGYTMVVKPNDNKIVDSVSGIEEVVTDSFSEMIQMENSVGMQSSGNIVTENELFSNLVSLFNSAQMSIEETLSKVDKNDSLYAGALYAKLKDFNIDDNIILQELENIVCFGTQATCVSEEMWNSLFGNLLGTISEYDNVVDYYYPLASYVHVNSCSLEHEKVFFDENRVTCTNLENLLNDKLPTFDYKSYVIDMINSCNDARFVEQLNRILNSDVSFDDVLNELEFVYQFSMIPTDLTEELWNDLFGTLMKTVDENVNVCIEYYDLAYYVHSLWCDLEHSINEYGRYECFDYSLTLEK